jgi:hypothetical protein
VEINRGVPQGSALGPTLWNLGYDSVISEQVDGAKVLCYADDTAIVVTADSVDIAIHNASVAATQVVKRIERLGLAVATHKTEATIFRKGRRHVSASTYLVVKGQVVEVTGSFKYLGIVFDCYWSF